MSIATSTISITSTTMRRPIRTESPTATGTATCGFGTGIRITRISTTVTSMSTRKRVGRSGPGKSK